MKNTEDFKRTIVYYTDNRLEEELNTAVQKQILKASNYGIDVPIISVSQKGINTENNTQDYKFGHNITVGYKPRCYLSLYEQLLEGLKAADDDSIIYLCEHDVFYHPSHFNFIPPRQDKYTTT
ncbi:hypothetical protein THIOSC15_490001 [uncultured Thiomicrorhabdus sp.]